LKTLPCLKKNLVGFKNIPNIQTTRKCTQPDTWSTASSQLGNRSKSTKQTTPWKRRKKLLTLGVWGVQGSFVFRGFFVVMQTYLMAIM
jgi:hypothetical protein